MRPPRTRTYDVPPETRSICIEWERFRSFGEACERFASASCLYALAREDRTALYVGKATGLRRRYGAALGTLNALMGAARNVALFVASVRPELLELAEHTIVFWDVTMYNTRGKRTRPLPQVPLLHRFDSVGSWWASGLAVERGKNYEGPLFCTPRD